MKQIAAVLAILAILSLGWGEATHIHIASKVVEEQYLTTVQRQALIFGSTAPDMRMLLNRNSEVHLMLHAQVFLDKLKSLAVTKEEKAFVAGYQSHLVSDPIERVYTSTKPNFGVPGEVIVDIMLERDVPSLKQIRVTASYATKSLLVRAWKATYPTYSWQMTSAFVDEAVKSINLYLWSMANSSIDPSSEIYAAYSDYRTPVQQSIDAGRLAIGVIAPVATPTPTATPEPTPTPTPWWWRFAR